MIKRAKNESLGIADRLQRQREYWRAERVARGQGTPKRRIGDTNRYNQTELSDDQRYLNSEYFDKEEVESYLDGKMEGRE